MSVLERPPGALPRCLILSFSRSLSPCPPPVRLSLRVVCSLKLPAGDVDRVACALEDMGASDAGDLADFDLDDEEGKTALGLKKLQWPKFARAVSALKAAAHHHHPPPPPFVPPPAPDVERAPVKAREQAPWTAPGGGGGVGSGAGKDDPSFWDPPAKARAWDDDDGGSDTTPAKPSAGGPADEIAWEVVLPEVASGEVAVGVTAGSEAGGATRGSKGGGGSGGGGGGGGAMAEAAGFEDNVRVLVDMFTGEHEASARVALAQARGNLEEAVSILQVVLAGKQGVGGPS